MESVAGNIMGAITGSIMENAVGVDAILILSVVTLLCIGIMVYQRVQTKRLMKSLDEMIEKAINGDFKEHESDETMLSSLESRMAKYLSQSAISARNIKEERNELKSLISDISHQTKTPLSNIMLYSELLENEVSDEEAGENLKLLQEQTKKLEFLIQALVKMSRLEAGILNLNPKRESVVKLVYEAAKEYTGQANEKGIYIKVSMDCDAIREKESSSHDGCQADRYINENIVNEDYDVTDEKNEKRAVFDYKWTLEALGNVVQNAIKYTDEGGIKIRIHSYEMYTCIEVEDTGIGIDENEIAKIFSRFYRGSNVSDESGVGIGLYLTRKILSEESGYIKVTSAKGAGSRFGIYLPNR